MRSLLSLPGTLLPGLIAAWALWRGVDVYSALLKGAEDGLRVLLRIVPALVCLLPAVAMLRESGAIDAFSALLAPLLEAVGIPPETTVLMLLRPVSGSAALAAAEGVVSAAGTDSLTGRTAAVMLGSTETTFYVLSVYFAAAGVKKSRHAVPAALCADAAGFLAAAWTVKLFFG